MGCEGALSLGGAGTGSERGGVACISWISGAQEGTNPASFQVPKPRI